MGNNACTQLATSPAQHQPGTLSNPPQQSVATPLTTCIRAAACMHLRGVMQCARACSLRCCIAAAEANRQETRCETDMAMQGHSCTEATASQLQPYPPEAALSHGRRLDQAPVAGRPSQPLRAQLLALHQLPAAPCTPAAARRLALPLALRRRRQPAAAPAAAAAGRSQQLAACQRCPRWHRGRSFQ